MSKNEAKEAFLAYIRGKGLRNTRQREDILEAFLSSGGHITVDDLYNKLKKNYPSIGYATVHRNMNLVLESGLAGEIKVGRGKTRYEQIYGHEHHDHLICVKCGRFMEVHDETIEKLQDNLAEANDFKPLKHKLEIYGLCRKCR